jgi:hypothetical protein
LPAKIPSCHHKAQRHVELIIEAIGRCGNGPPAARHPQPRPHPALRMWQDALGLLRGWLGGGTPASTAMCIGDVPAGELLAALGEPTPLKRWQVQRVIERINSFVDPGSTYQYLRRPDYILASEEPHDVGCYFCTRRTLIQEDPESPDPGLSLAVAIDMLMPCNWNFPHNLRIVLRAIGGVLISDEPFAACGRNIVLNPVREPMRLTANALDQFCGAGRQGEPVDPQVLDALGEPTPQKAGLALALSRRIRSQLRL